ncbi:hypothetical protein BDZ91DRAFT_248506 [Kalaharituber pfeilii]|nr:hypothetical protein BDZ91DRAFT_248506 [Kalaharituber pfeilii]
MWVSVFGQICQFTSCTTFKCGGMKLDWTHEDAGSGASVVTCSPIPVMQDRRVSLHFLVHIFSKVHYSSTVLVLTYPAPGNFAAGGHDASWHPPSR